MDGHDTLTAVGNGDTLDGGAGHDVLQLKSAEMAGTTFRGGTGDDLMTGGTYADTYVFNRGDGDDTIGDFGSNNYVDKLVFGSGIVAADLGAKRSGNDVIISVAGQAGDRIKIRNWFLDAAGASQVELLVFADGSTWSQTQLTQLALTTSNLGTSGNDTLSGNLHYAETIRGMDGHDTLTAVGNGDTLEGGAGHDVLITSSNAIGTVFRGGTGDDVYTGSSYADIYHFDRGDGADIINDNAAGRVETDVLKFGSGITEEQLWFSRSGNHLDVGVIGTTDNTRINNWYTNASYQIEVFELSDGQRLLNSQVNTLVQAMAAFAPPAPGETTLSPTYQTALAPVIAANWN